jgi:hypothetical protein
MLRGHTQIEVSGSLRDGIYSRVGFTVLKSRQHTMLLMPICKT